MIKIIQTLSDVMLRDLIGAFMIILKRWLMENQLLPF